jgi:ABC-type glycerol-3-phosphate transport system substrate-binding protein
MTKRISLVTTLALFVAALGLAACGGKGPKSTTTTRTQSTTTTDTGDNTSSDTKETVTQQPDGSQTLERTETTNKEIPPPGGPKQ